MALKIKKEYLTRVVAFNNSGKPLGERNESDLLDLAILARSSNDQLLLGSFDGEVPTLEALQKLKGATIPKP